MAEQEATLRQTRQEWEEQTHRAEREREELQEEVRALQRERDQSLLQAETDKQQVGQEPPQLGGKTLTPVVIAINVELSMVLLSVSFVIRLTKQTKNYS